MDLLLDALLDALSWLLIPRSTWGFIIRAALAVVLVLVVLELT